MTEKLVGFLGAGDNLAVAFFAAAVLFIGQIDLLPGVVGGRSDLGEIVLAQLQILRGKELLHIGVDGAVFHRLVFDPLLGGFFFDLNCKKIVAGFAGLILRGQIVVDQIAQVNTCFNFLISDFHGPFIGIAGTGCQGEDHQPDQQDGDNGFDAIRHD